MLDKRTEFILSSINEKCEEGSYKIIEVAELISQLPDKYAMDREGLADAINYLCERDYLKCKYSDDKVYCVVPLPKGRLYHETLEKEKRQRFSYRKLVIIAFIGAVLGGALGNFFSGILIKIIGG